MVPLRHANFPKDLFYNSLVLIFTATAAKQKPPIHTHEAGSVKILGTERAF